MQVAGARISGDFNRGSKLERVGPLGPGKVIDKIVQRQLEIVAEVNSLIQTQERVPLLVGVAYDAKALASESPMKGVGHGRTENGDISQGKPFAMVDNSLHWSTRGEFARQCPVSAR